MIKDYFKFTLSTLRNRKIRSLLTMVGIFIGIATVVGLISVGQGMQDAIDEQFEKMGTNKIMVVPGGDFIGAIGTGISSAQLTDHDVALIKKVRGVDLVGAMIYKSAKVEFKEDVKYVIVSGLPTDESRKIIEDMQSVKIKSGRNLKETDRHKVVIGIRVAEGELFE